MFLTWTNKDGYLELLRSNNDVQCHELVSLWYSFASSGLRNNITLESARLDRLGENRFKRDIVPASNMLVLENADVVNIYIAYYKKSREAEEKMLNWFWEKIRLVRV